MQKAAEIPPLQMPSSLEQQVDNSALKYDSSVTPEPFKSYDFTTTAASAAVGTQNVPGPAHKTPRLRSMPKTFLTHDSKTLFHVRGSNIARI